MSMPMSLPLPIPIGVPAYADKGEVDRAIEDYNIAIDLNPKYAAAYYNRGLVYNNKDDFDAAIEDFSKAIDLNPEYVGSL